MGKKAMTVFLFMCHTFGIEVAREYQRIVRATKGLGKTLLLFQGHGNELPSKLAKHRKYLFTDQSLAGLKYPMISKSMIPGSCHFPLLQFYLDHPGYDFYWLIEYDVRFSGDWRKFFKYFNRSQADLLACNIRSYADEPNWAWWRLSHPSIEIPLEKRYASYDPIYRVSNRGLKLIHRALRDGWSGHQEVIIATLLHRHGYRLRDFGGNGRFVKPKDKNRFYRNDSKQATVRWRPPFRKIGKDNQKLYHPVKSF